MRPPATLIGLVHDRGSTTAMLWFEAALTAGFILIFAWANRPVAAPSATAAPVYACGTA